MFNQLTIDMKEQQYLQRSELRNGEVYVCTDNDDKKFISRYNEGGSKGLIVNTRYLNFCNFTHIVLGWHYQVRLPTKYERVWLWACERENKFITNSMAAKMYGESGEPALTDEEKTIDDYELI